MPIVFDHERRYYLGLEFWASRRQPSMLSGYMFLTKKIVLSFRHYSLILLLLSICFLSGTVIRQNFCYETLFQSAFKDIRKTEPNSLKKILNGRK